MLLFIHINMTGRDRHVYHGCHLPVFFLFPGTDPDVSILFLQILSPSKKNTPDELSKNRPACFLFLYVIL